MVAAAKHSVIGSFVTEDNAGRLDFGIIVVSKAVAYCGVAPAVASAQTWR